MLWVTRKRKKNNDQVRLFQNIASIFEFYPLQRNHINSGKDKRKWRRMSWKRQLEGRNGSPRGGDKKSKRERATTRAHTKQSDSQPPNRPLGQGGLKGGEGTAGARLPRGKRWGTTTLSRLNIIFPENSGSFSRSTGSWHWENLCKSRKTFKIPLDEIFLVRKVKSRFPAIYKLNSTTKTVVLLYGNCTVFSPEIACTAIKHVAPSGFYVWDGTKNRISCKFTQDGKFWQKDFDTRQLDWKEVIWSEGLQNGTRARGITWSVANLGQFNFCMAAVFSVGWVELKPCSSNSRKETLPTGFWISENDQTMTEI